MCIVITAGVSYFDFTLIGVYLHIRECIFMHCECIFTHCKCIFTHSRVYIYATSAFNTTGVNLHLFGVNIEAKQFTPKKCIFMPVVNITLVNA